MVFLLKELLSMGVSLDDVLKEFIEDLEKSNFVIGHNISFDNNIIGCEFLRKKLPNALADISSIDTKDDATDYCKIAGSRGGKFKWPNLTELHVKLFGEDFSEAHNASADVEATARCFLELVRLGIIPFEKAGLTSEEFEKYREINPSPFKLIGLNIEPYTPTDPVLYEEESDPILKEENRVSKSPFSHLHVHSQFSVLQGTADIQDLVNRAVEMGMPAVGLTDHTNMFGAYKFIQTVLNHSINTNSNNKKSLKAVLGCELNICKNHRDKSTKDYGFQIPLLCKNIYGFHNLSKLSSLAYIDGFYYVPRVDKDLIKVYKKGLIVLTGSLYGAIPNLILNVGEPKRKKSLNGGLMFLEMIFMLKLIDIIWMKK